MNRNTGSAAAACPLIVDLNGTEPAALRIDAGPARPGAASVGWGLVSASVDAIAGGQAIGLLAAHGSPRAALARETRANGLRTHQLGPGLNAYVWESDDHDMGRVAETAYRALFDAAAGDGTPHLLRIWQFFSRIHEADAGHPGLDRYQAFCVGRRIALRERDLDARCMPAATAIGRVAGASDGTTTPAAPGFSLTAIACAAPGHAIENPRQVPAHRYPSRYSPESPAFARATLVRGRVVETASERNAMRAEPLLLVSGTASIVGHQSLHIGDVGAQASEILRNLDALRDAAVALSEARLIARQLRVYLRRGDDRQAVAALVKRWLESAADGPSTPVPPRHAERCRVDFWLGEVCRPELLVEIEGIFTAVAPEAEPPSPEPTGRA